MGSCRGHRARGASPKAGRQRPYVATTEQVWALYDAMPDHLRPAILLGAFVGLRLAETCGLRTTDVDFMRGIVHPAIQYPNDPLKSEISRTAVPIPRSLALELSAHVAAFPGEGSGCSSTSGATNSPRTLQRHFTQARDAVPGLTPAFRYHDLRALPRLAADRLRCRREGGPGSVSARLGQDDAGHLQPPLAGFRRQHPRSSECGAGRS